MRVFRGFGAVLLLAAFGFEAKVQAATGSLRYALSPGFWSDVSDLTSSQQSLSKMNSFLEGRYGYPEETFAEIEATIPMAWLSDRGWAQELHVQPRFEGILTGKVLNPVVPELLAHQVLSGGLEIALEGSASSLQMNTRAYALGGIASEKKVSAVSTDLIEKLPVQSGTLHYFGAGVVLHGRIAEGTSFGWEWGASSELVRFQSSFPGGPFLAWRWRLESKLSSNRTPRGFSARFILGPQPLPQKTLPRVWDYVHRLDPLPEIGTLLGAGLVWSSPASWIRAEAGFYGGYWGGVIRVGRPDGIALRLENMGIETGSAYRILGERVISAGIEWMI